MTLTTIRDDDGDLCAIDLTELISVRLGRYGGDGLAVLGELRHPGAWGQVIVLERIDEGKTTNYAEQRFALWAAEVTKAKSEVLPS